MLVLDQKDVESLLTEAAVDIWEFILDFYGLPQDDLD